MYTVELSKSSEKALIVLSKKDQKRVVGALESLKNDPFTGKKLQGPLKGLWSIRVWPFRIIYSIHKKRVMVSVVAIGNRKDIYNT